MDEYLQYHNKKELLTSKYKKASSIKVDYNKMSLNLAYMIIKCYPVVDKKSQGILQNIKDNDLTDMSSYYVNQKINSFLFNYYQSKLLPVGDDFTMLRDWIVMKRAAKEKIPLTKKSIRKIKEDHDRLAVNQAYRQHYKARNGKSLKVPKESVYNDLRKILPDTFEWLKTDKRLSEESAMQHHCVWSYDYMVSRDECAIYSFVDFTGEYTDNWRGEPVRYTIEFRLYKRNCYKVEQVQGKYNALSCKKMKDYIKGLLKEKAPLC